MGVGQQRHIGVLERRVHAHHLRVRLRVDQTGMSVARLATDAPALVPVLFVQDVWAGLILPESSHYQGSAYQVAPGGSVRVDFAVYDTLGGNEFADAGFAAPGDGQFTYVYQIFNEVDDSTFSIDLFRIFEIEPAGIADPKANQISSEDDLAGGIAADSQSFNPSFTNGIWEFEQGALIQGEHSWFLTISSDHDYVAGNFVINSPGDEVAVPPVPEPATMILLGVGSAILMARRRDSVGAPR